MMCLAPSLSRLKQSDPISKRLESRIKPKRNRELNPVQMVAMACLDDHFWESDVRPAFCVIVKTLVVFRPLVLSSSRVDAGPGGRLTLVVSLLQSIVTHSILSEVCMLVA